MAGRSPTARNALIVGRTQAVATQPIPQALLEFEPPTAARTEGAIEPGCPRLPQPLSRRPQP